MDARPLFQSLQTLAEENVAFFQSSGTESGRRFAAAFQALREHGRRLEPALRHFSRLYHRFDLDEATPGNGFRSLVQTARACLAHAVQKSRYVAAHRRSVFFRAGHNAAELEAYVAALAQLRAVLCLAQRLLAHSRPGCLFPPEEAGLSELVLREYSTMHNGCFYGRCLGFQFAPSIRPFLQTIAIGLVSFGENYKRNELGLGVAAGSLFTSGKFAIDPELRGAEFERLTQNLDVHFWKSFWNLTETELLASVASMTSTPVGVCRALTVPPEPLELPLATDPSVTVTIAPPVAHTGPGPVHMRLLSHHLRQGQDSAALSALTRSEGPRAPLRWRQGPPLPPSPSLLVHFHGGGFVAQTSRSHEPYLRGWACELGAPILSVDYALAPESPFPRALEECFYGYCWALRHCHLLGSTAQRVCLAGDSAGGNLCLAVSLRAAALGVRPPHGIVAAYPVTLVQAAASPSRLLTLLDPLLPLAVLCKCLSAYAGTEAEAEASPPPEPLGPRRLLQRETERLVGGLRRGGAWLGGLLGRGPPSSDKSLPGGPREPPEEPPAPPEAPPEAEGAEGYPDEFCPLRSRGPPARFCAPPAPLARNPYVSPLLAPDSMLGGLPPLHLVACALDPMLDDSVALARRLRALGRPVSLSVVPDLPHGFLSLGALSPEARRAADLCTRRIRAVLAPDGRGSLAPHELPRRGSVYLGGGLAPHESPRRGSVLLGSGLDPQDAPRRGSMLLGTRRDSLAPQDTPRRGSVLGGGLAPHDSSRRGSVLLGARRDSLAPQDLPRRGSVFAGDGLAPHESPRRGSVLLGARRNSLAPQDAPRHGSVLGGTRRDSLLTHSTGGIERLGPLTAATHNLGDVGSSALPHSSRVGSGASAQTHSSGAAVTHSSGAAVTHSDGPALTHSSGAAVTHSDGPALTHSSGAAVTHSDGPALTHSNGAAVTHGTTLTDSSGAALTHSNTLTHSDGTALPHSTVAALPHNNGASPPHARAVLPHSIRAALPHGRPPPPRRPSGPAGREVGS
ncbi:hormone-sensitive lipase isoform X2 [Cuculus canorus]|nr:hormone-sensitive lipase isoform X2 [Cuculus canorus]